MKTIKAILTTMTLMVSFTSMAHLSVLVDEYVSLGLKTCMYEHNGNVTYVTSLSSQKTCKGFL